MLTLEPAVIDQFPSFKRRMNWFIENRGAVAERNMASLKQRGKGDRLLLSLVSKERLLKILKRMLDETEFLAEYGIRSLSKYHENNPYSMEVNGQKFEVAYLSGESDSGLFGGNSNWRGPIWLCVNFLLVESLLRFHMFYGDSLKVECPTGSGDYMHLGHVAEEIQHRLQHLFAVGDDGRRAVNNGKDMLDFDPLWKDYLWFYEYFDGDTGRGLGASHQCGWSGLIAKMIHDTGYVVVSIQYQAELTIVPGSTAAFPRLPERHQQQQRITLMMFLPNPIAPSPEFDVRPRRDPSETEALSTYLPTVITMTRMMINRLSGLCVQIMRKGKGAKVKLTSTLRSTLPSNLSVFKATSRSSTKMSLRRNWSNSSVIEPIEQAVVTLHSLSVGVGY